MTCQKNSTQKVLLHSHATVKIVSAS